MSLQSTLSKINSLLIQIKQCLKVGNFELPLMRCSRQFDMDRKIMIRKNPIQIIFKKTTVNLVLRIVQILMIVRNLLVNNKFITKRNLYYQLLKYYPYYLILDNDLMIICDSLKIQRSLLNIIVSSKLQLFWFNTKHINQNNQIKLELCYKKFTQQNTNQIHKIQTYQHSSSQQVNKPTFIPKQHITLIPHQIFKIPNCPKLQVNILYPNEVISEDQRKINFLIMQKESLFEILSQSLTYKLPQKNQNWILMNSKGYPDMTALQFVNQMIRNSKKQNIYFYYIGDYDIYGIDIMLNYAIGNELYEGLWQRLRWFSKFEQLIDYQQQQNKGFKNKFKQSQYRKQTIQDKKKTRQILMRDYLQIDKMMQRLQNLGEQQQNKQKIIKHKLFIQKSSKWRYILQDILQSQYQCQVQSYFKNWLYPFDLIELMINQQFYI